MTEETKSNRRKSVSNTLLFFAVAYSIFIVVGDFMGKDMDNTVTMYMYFLMFVAAHEGVNMATPAGGFKR